LRTVNPTEHPHRSHSAGRRLAPQSWALVIRLKCRGSGRLAVQVIVVIVGGGVKGRAAGGRGGGRRAGGRRRAVAARRPVWEAELRAEAPALLQRLREGLHAVVARSQEPTIFCCLITIQQI